MQPLKFSLILTFLIYAIFYDSTVLKIFLMVSAGVCLFYIVTPTAHNGLRKRITIATWKGNITLAESLIR